jgi:predicted NACHT family NTPase
MLVNNYGVSASFCEFIQQRLRSGQCVLLLDGWDEIREDSRDEFVRKLRRLLDGELSENLLVVSSRPIGDALSRFPLDRVTTFELGDFDRHDTERFVFERWFHASDQYVDICKKITSGSRAVRDLSRNPFMLSALCVVGQAQGVFPETRVELYRACSHTLYTLV